MEQIITLRVDLFLPPCGDCTFALNPMPNWTMLLPPCGDGIEWKLKYIAAFKLSPPYGDCTPRNVLHPERQQVFAPLRGLY